MSTDCFNSRQLRNTLGRFATGVTIITSRSADGSPIGMTCNSFASVSLEPPLVQWSIAKSSRSYPAIAQAEQFAVHVLDAGQHALCQQFATKDGDRFANVPLETNAQGLQLLTRYHARFECDVYARHDAGDHTIIIGRVLRLCEQEGEPLIFYRGQLANIAPIS